MCGNRSAVKARVAKSTWNRVTEVARGVRAVRHTPRQQAVIRSHFSTDVNQMETATGSQDAEYLLGGFGFHVLIEVVPHHRRQHPVELAVTIGQLLNICAIKPNPRPVRLLLGTSPVSYTHLTLPTILRV